MEANLLQQELSAKDEFIIELLKEKEALVAHCSLLQEWNAAVEGTLATRIAVEEGDNPLREHTCEECEGEFSGRGESARCYSCDLVEAVCIGCCKYKSLHGHQKKRRV